MDIQWMPNHDVGVPYSEVTYRVRMWKPPIKAFHAWFVDEYEIYNAPSVKEVLVWAETEAAGDPVEVFVKWSETVVTAPDGVLAERPQMTRIFGAAPDEDAPFQQ